MIRKVSILFIIILLSIIPICIQDTISLEAPHIEGTKIISPQRVLKEQKITVTIKLTGEGDITLAPIDVVLILDKSGSMRGDKIIDAKEAAKSFLDYTFDVDKVSLVTFSNDPKINFDLQFMNSANEDLLKVEIDAIIASGSTNIYDSIVTANEILTDSPRGGVPLVEILLTDGAHNYPSFLSDSDFESLAAQTRDKGIIIYTIGLGEDVNEKRLELIANTTGGKYYFAPNSEDLGDIFEDIASFLNIAGTDIVVSETIPSYLSYNGDASKNPDETTTNDGVTLKWNIGTLSIGKEWNVTYTAQTKEAVESSDLVSQTRIDYIKTDAASTTINLEPGLIYNDIALTYLAVKHERVTQGDINEITTTVESQGSVQRTFDLEIRYDSTLINSQSLTLNPGQTKNVTYSWNTSSAEVGRYTITATIDPDQQIWEQDRTDNTATTEVEISSASEYPFIIIFIAILLLLTVPIVAAAMYSKPRGGPPRCEECGEFLFYDKRTRRWYCKRCRRYVL
ncbi:hypothetical protein AC481_05090 [miscellaneous Crenarchaeota group archaeon SMTZ-80]|nr:MAG: hypothetical protein AC481_05090 [miscellaneous Crenarchaeota group archaeon SMTZ-80]